MTTPYDPRSVANLILDKAEQYKVNITSIALQKLLYFANGMYLVRYGKPLVSGYFEAWKYGPVHPAVYAAFKSAKAMPITFRASGKDPLTGKKRELQKIDDSDVSKLVTKMVIECGELSIGRLIDLSHAKDGPWDFIEKKSRQSVVVGMRISNSVIIELFKNHKVPLNDSPYAGEPLEDVPITERTVTTTKPRAKRSTTKIARD